MKKIVTLLLAMTFCATSAFAANSIRISQVYGGGGSTNTSATYNVDYVELFNASGVAVNLSGWTVEYGSATGNWGSNANNIFTFPQGASIGPCKYLLLEFGSPSTGGGPLPVPADFFGNLTLSGSSGKVAVFNAVNTNLACGSELPGTLIDKVAYGTANCAEVTATGGFSVDTGAVRGAGGLTDTDNNSADFAIVLNPVPHNSASPANTACLATPNASRTWGAIKTIYR